MRNDVLVIEDDPTLGTLFKTFLSFDQIEATVCQRGRDALQRIDEQELNLSLVILDMHLPDMSGEEIFAYLQAEYPRIAIMIVTADSNLYSLYSTFHPKTFKKPMDMADFRAEVQASLF